MKDKKSKPLQLDAEAARQIATAIAFYADAAYPPGGSECAQATHQTLKTLADNIMASPGRALFLKRRQLPVIKAALRWYYAEELRAAADVDPEELILQLK